MILIYSFPRSGSSIFQKELSKVLFDYEIIFEPFAFLPNKIKHYKNFEEIHSIFKGAPSLENLSKYKIDKNYVGNIPIKEFNSKKIYYLRKLIKEYFSLIISEYGNKLIVKFVRQQQNSIFIHSVLQEINPNIKIIFLKRDYFEIAYSMYRNGMASKYSQWHFNKFFQYRKLLSKDKSMFLKSKNFLDKTISSILSDYSAFDYSLNYFKENNIEATLINYEEFVSNTDLVLQDILKRFKFNFYLNSLKNSSYKNDKLDISKLYSSKNDIFFNFFKKRTIRNLQLDYNTFDNSKFTLKYLIYYLNNFNLFYLFFNLFYLFFRIIRFFLKLIKI